MCSATRTTAPRQRLLRLVVWPCLVALLAGCAPPLTYADTVATAQAGGCWPGNALPPAPATITPAGQPAAYPRCTPAPGETQLPWPTRLPARAQFPTMLPVNQPGSTVMQTIMQLPDAILSVDVAVHPLSGDPAVAAIAAPLTSTGGPHAFVRSYDGRTRTWGALQNLDIGAAAIGQHRFRSIALAVSGDGTITAVWGATAHPVYGLWASISRDGGASWAAPEHLADNVFGVLDVAATLDGQVAVLALQREPVAPIVITRAGDGTWSTPDRIPVQSAWYGSSGSLVLVGEGAAARLVALTTGFGPAPGVVFLAARALHANTWHVVSRRVDAAAGERLAGNVRGLSAGSGTSALVAFSFAILGAPGAYALVSNDAGASWGEIERMTPAEHAAHGAAPFSALAYDPAARRLAALWTCCEDARWESAESTHYGAWSVPGSAAWQPSTPVPVITGAAAAADTALAQAPNSRLAWLAWVEHGDSVAVRALDLNRLIDAAEYPLPTVSAEVQP